jgi:hypothetical protein
MLSVLDASVGISILTFLRPIEAQPPKKIGVNTALAREYSMPLLQRLSDAR